MIGVTMELLSSFRLLAAVAVTLVVIIMLISRRVRGPDMDWRDREPGDFLRVGHSTSRLQAFAYVS